ncbi:MAG: hypothetical protein K1X57_03500 [Gemmataceae bacterium]|nr:hypothetical protein [Gemmataceae bacterium]
MSLNQTSESSAIRLWPGIGILSLVAIAMFVPRLVVPQTMVHFISMFAGPPLGLLLALIWWLFLAKVRGPMRWLVPAFVVLPAIGLALTLYKSTELAVVIFAVPFVLAIWVGWLTIRGRHDRRFSVSGCSLQS